MSSVPVRSMIEASDRDDVAALLARVGLDPEPGPPTLLDPEPFYAVVEDIVDAGDDHLPYRYAKRVQVDALGVLGLALKTAADLGAALRRAERYVGLLGDAVTYSFRAEGRRAASFVVRGRPAHRPGIAVANEGAIAAILSICRQAAGPSSDLRPTSVSFAHQPISSPSAQEAYFGCPVEHGAAVDALRFDAGFLDTPTRLADEGLSDYFLGQLDDALRATEARQGVESRVRDVVANRLADGVPPMHVVANRLAMSERTLHRRLAAENLRYQDVVVDVRRTVAVALLTTTDHSLLDVAFLTGFAEQSSFQRAFKRWTGRTPLQVRQG
ncbi:MAG: AraC family transcriptional regulator [Acidimicrobiales bacterium]